MTKHIVRTLALTILGLAISSCLPGGAPNEQQASTSEAEAVEPVPTNGDQELSDENAAPIDTVDLGPVMAEPNNLDQPLSLRRIPGRAAGFYDGEGDVDALAMFTDELTRMGVTTVEVSPVPGMRPVLRLLDGDMTPPRELAVWRAEQAGQGAGVPNLGPLEGISRVIFAVSEAEDRSSPVAYTLSLHRPEPRDGDWFELEPNDDEAHAGLIDGSGTPSGTPSGTIIGSFHGSQDLDLFRLVLPIDASVSTTLRPDASSDVSLRWQIGQQGDEIIQDLAGEGEPEQLCARFVPAGTLLVETAARTGEMAALSTYELAVRVETEGFEREPNDRPTLIGLQIVEGDVRGFIDTISDVDAFGLRIVPSVDGSAEQAIEVAPPSGIDVAIEVLDDVGDSVSPREDRGGPGQPERVFVPRVFMTYRVLVSSGRQGGTSCEAPYRVHLPPN